MSHVCLLFLKYINSIEKYSINIYFISLSFYQNIFLVSIYSLFLFPTEPNTIHVNYLESHVLLPRFLVGFFFSFLKLMGCRNCVMAVCACSYSFYFISFFLMFLYKDFAI